MARPTIFTPEVAALICENIASTTMSLKKICDNDENLPCVGTVLKWLREDKEGFLTQYTRAKETQADLLADEMMEIADDTSGDELIDEDGKVRENREFINRSRLRVDTRKWIASKLKPKKYGDRVTTKHTGNLGLQINGMEIITGQSDKK